MGLDAYAGRMWRVDDDTIDFVRERFCWCSPDNVLALSVDTPMSDDVRALCRESDAYCLNTDWSRIYSDFDVNPDWEVVSYGNRPDHCEITFAEHFRAAEHPATKSVKISNFDMERKYERICSAKFFFVGWEEIAYWRDDRHIREIASEGQRIENCGYYGISEDQFGRMCRGHGLSLPEGSIYAYHEWF